jgi:hypothetical protein
VEFAETFSHLILLSMLQEELSYEELMVISDACLPSSGFEYFGDEKIEICIRAIA